VDSFLDWYPPEQVASCELRWTGSTNSLCYLSFALYFPCSSSHWHVHDVGTFGTTSYITTLTCTTSRCTSVTCYRNFNFFYYVVICIYNDNHKSKKNDIRYNDILLVINWFLIQLIYVLNIKFYFMIRSPSSTDHCAGNRLSHAGKLI
jgi:hypothetical protein